MLIRNQMTTEAAILYFHAMILTHISYCLTTWSQANANTKSLMHTVYKQALKILDKKSYNYHHCTIIRMGCLPWTILFYFQTPVYFSKSLITLSPLKK